MNFAAYTTKTKQEILTELRTAETGLDKEEILKRQAEYGPNKIKAKEVHWWQVFFRQFKSPFIYLLLAAALLAFFLREIIDSVMILIFVAVNTFLGFYQEYHSEQAIKLLKKYINPRARVRRENQETVIDASDLVPGDFVILEAGDMIPADLCLVSENDLTINEEILTGESVPARKTSKEFGKPATEIYQAENIGFSGTTVVGGKGAGIVFATGKNTALGEIAKLTVETERVSGFEKGILKFSRFILRMILVTLVFVFLANVLIKGEKIAIGELLIFSIALAVSVIPEALPVVTTISLSRGALRLAKNHVVVKRLSAIEDLGSIEVLCADKTGTLTENKLTVAEIYFSDSEKVIFYANLASTFFPEETKRAHDPFDLALWHRLSPLGKRELSNYKKINEIPFDPKRKRNSVLIRQNGKYELIVRGAPEFIINASENLIDREKDDLFKWFAEEGRRGRRVLAVGSKKRNSAHYDATVEEKSLTFLGLISFVDPIKHTAKNTVLRAEKLGVKIKIITGDGREVAGAVAYEIGLIKSPLEVITGEELDNLSFSDQHEAVQKYSVFARVSPEQKYKIIHLIQEKNEVGFLGEGINDAPALKISNVAIVVRSAADIARDSADVILLQKSLDVIVSGIREGRKIFANVIKYIKVTLASNFGNFFAIAIASLLIDFLPMLSVQILLLNLLSDFPMIAIATDKIDPDELKRPRNYNVRGIALFAIILGLISTVFDFIFFGLFYRISPAVLQTNWFIGSILTELALIFSVRTKFFFLKTKRPSNILSGLSILAAFLTVLLPFTYFGQTRFKFVAPQINYLWLIIGVVVGYFVVTESVKLIYHRFLNHNYKV